MAIRKASVSTAPTVRESVFAFLREAGTTTVFGNPGSTELRFLRDWPDDFRYIVALHEGCSVAMADAYAQLTRNAAIVNLHSAGGLGNAMGSVFSAYRNQTPLVITAGQQSRAMFPSVPFLFAQDATTLPQPYVKWSCEPARAEDVPAAIARAHGIALQPPYGPTFVSIPEDDWDRPAEYIELRRGETNFRASPSAIERVAAALERCARPALVVGPGVDRNGAADAAVALAERTGAAVFVSPLSSRCSFPERHPNFAGFLPPVRAGIVDVLRPFDVVLVLGGPVFTYHVPSPGPPITAGTEVFQLVDDPAAASTALAGTSILTTLREPLEELARRVPARATRPPRATRAPVTRGSADPLSGAFVLSTLSRMLPPGTIVVEEAPSHRNALHDYLPITEPGTFFAAASGSLGWALPAAVGAALARPSERVVAILGDGSSAYAIQGLWTAARHGLAITFLILNNRAYAAMDQFSRYLGFTGTPSFDLAGIDFVSAAAAFGCRGVRVERAEDVETALAASFADPLPTLVDVRVDDGAGVIY
jgi:benzoylformate decarboxylase